MGAWANRTSTQLSQLALFELAYRNIVWVHARHADRFVLPYGRQLLIGCCGRMPPSHTCPPACSQWAR